MWRSLGREGDRIKRWAESTRQEARSPQAPSLTHEAQPPPLVGGAGAAAGGASSGKVK